jgi:ribosomal protein L37AE/L43A
MPDRDVKTIQDIIYYQYAKIIAKSTFKVDSGIGAKKHYAFVKTKFKQLKDGTISWSDILREDLQFVESDKTCIYCGTNENIHKDHIVPRSINISDRCKSCDKLIGIHNYIWACQTCNSSKSNKGLYSYYKLKYPDEKKYYDFIPTLLEKKYLKTIYYCHKCSDTLNSADLDGDGQITVLDIDFIIGKLDEQHN